MFTSVTVRVHLQQYELRSLLAITVVTITFDTIALFVASLVALLSVMWHVEDV
jgi:hypothetical protein